MSKDKKIALLIILTVGLPLVYGAFLVISHFAPIDLSQNERALWVAKWSGSIAIVIVILLLALLYRFWFSKKG